MNYFNPLDFDRYYHVYNRANGKENLFINRFCYDSFLERFHYYLTPVAKFYSYNLLKNHFHYLIKTLTQEEITENSKNWSQQTNQPYKILQISKQFSNCFNSYSKWFNKLYSRNGSLFQKRFKRLEIFDEYKLRDLTAYIHTNAQHHRFVSEFTQWKYSSYDELLNNGKSNLQREEIFSWYNGKEQFVKFHQEYSKIITQDNLIFE